MSDWPGFDVGPTEIVMAGPKPELPPDPERYCNSEQRWIAHEAYCAQVPDPSCCGRPMLKVDSGRWKRQGFREWMCWTCERHDRVSDFTFAAPEPHMTITVNGPLPTPGDAD